MVGWSIDATNRFISGGSDRCAFLASNWSTLKNCWRWRPCQSSLQRCEAARFQKRSAATAASSMVTSPILSQEAAVMDATTAVPRYPDHCWTKMIHNYMVTLSWWIQILAHDHLVWWLKSCKAVVFCIFQGCTINNGTNIFKKCKLSNRCQWLISWLGQRIPAGVERLSWLILD